MPRTLICRRNYGFEWGEHFRPGIDEEKYAYVSWGEKFCAGRMKWMIEKVNSTTPFASGIKYR